MQYIAMSLNEQKDTLAFTSGIEFLFAYISYLRVDFHTLPKLF